LRGREFKSPPGEKFGSRFLLHLHLLATLAIMSTPIIQCQLTDSEGEDWPPILICRGRGNEVVDAS